MVVTPTHATPTGPRPAVWKLALAFAVVYLGYGLNFLAVKIGVETLPAFLFAGAHVFTAGVIIMAWRQVREGSIALPPVGRRRAAIQAAFLFVGGVGLVTEGEKLGLPSGIAAIIKASVPLWIAVLESTRPGGERPGAVVVVGLLCGAAGVAWLVLPRLAGGVEGQGAGTAVLMLSALLFAIGSIYVRHYPPADSTAAGVSAMMVFGGVYLLLAGTMLGEIGQIGPDDFTPRVLAAFAFLLVVHSLAAFSAMNWLLRHLPAAVVTTKFYVSPAIAVLAGWLVLGERVTPAAVVSLSLILAGVGVVLWGESRRHAEPALLAGDPDELEA